MATWNSRGLRGSTLEDLINRTNEKYRENGLALIQKVPTPITPIKIDKESRHITLAYFDQKSTVDYIGAVQGIPVCFDAKECAADTFALQNIHEHQVTFMEDFEKQAREDATETCKESIMLQAIANQEGITVSQEEIDEALQKRAESNGYESVEALKGDLNSPNYEDYAMCDKVMAFLQDNAVITEIE